MTVQHADHPTSSNTDNEKSREMECEREVAGSDLLYQQSVELITRVSAPTAANASEGGSVDTACRPTEGRPTEQ